MEECVMLRIRRVALALVSALMLATICSITVFAEEGLSGLQDQVISEGLTDEETEGLEATSDKPTNPENLTNQGVSGNTSATFSGTYRETGNAVDDILDDARFSGSINSIKKVTAVVDKWFIFVISIVAFFIISAAMLKNVCAGAYVANPRFWDKVYDAHQKVGSQSINGIKQYFTGGGILNSQLTSFGEVLLVIVPNLKAFTDFENSSSENIDPKAYFSKSIPQMLLCVIIGIFIYNGYYRDTASKVGAFGAESFTRFVGEADPVALADRLYNTTGKPKTAYDRDKSIQGQLGKALADKTYSLYVSTYHDITGAGSKSKLMAAIVNDVNGMVTALRDYTKPDAKSPTGYEYAFSVNVDKSVDSPIDPTRTTSTTGNTTIWTAVYKLHTNEDLGIHYTDIDPTTTGMESVRYTITFTKNLDKFTEATVGYIRVYFHDSSDKVAKDVVVKALQDKRVASAFNNGTSVTNYTMATIDGRSVPVEEDGKTQYYRIVASEDSDVAAGSVKVEDPVKDNP